VIVMATRTLKYPKLGTAKFSRICPSCGELIHAGDPIAHQGKTWVHLGCYFDPRLKRADARLKDAFFATAESNNINVVINQVFDRGAILFNLVINAWNSILEIMNFVGIDIFHNFASRHRSRYPHSPGLVA